MVRERGERPVDPVPPKPAVSAPSVAELPIDWMAIDALEQAEILEHTLGVWVPNAVVEFGLSERVVPRCWYKHSAMIHELLALFQYRQQQQFNLDLGPPASAPIDFQYQFSLWRHRMRDLTTDAGCTASAHRPQERPSWADPDSTESAMWAVDLEEYVQEMFAFVPPAPSPHPSIENGDPA